jgi:rod shape-determining protein MreC
MLIPRKYQTIAIASILVIASLVILSVSLHRPGETDIFKRLVLETSSPLIRMMNGTVETVADVWRRYIFLIGLEKENQTLKRQVAELTRELNDYREVSFEAQRLKDLMALREGLSREAVAARVIGRETTTVFKTILINRGTSHGLRVGLPVVSVQGVVGKIVEASWNVSRVLLVNDYNSNVDAILQGSRAQGILQGGNDNLCSLKYVERSEDVRIGETLMTSGLGGIFPKGLILGTVLAVDKKGSGLFQKIDVIPAVPFTRLEEVVVLTTKGGDQP